MVPGSSPGGGTMETDPFDAWDVWCVCCWMAGRSPVIRMTLGELIGEEEWESEGAMSSQITLHYAPTRSFISSVPPAILPTFPAFPPIPLPFGDNDA
jgi:hypothetical protein